MASPNMIARIRRLFARRDTRLASVASLLWLAIALAYGLGYGNAGSGRGYAGTMLFAVTAIFPLALIWILVAASAGLRNAGTPEKPPASASKPLAQSLAANLEPRLAQLDSRLSDLARATKSIADSVTRLQADRATLPDQIAASLRQSFAETPAEPASHEPEQARLPLPDANPQNSVGPTIDDIIRAANFPSSDSDFVAVNAIRQALKNRNMAQLLQAAEDMLNLLAQDGIYMDDLKLAPTSAPQWRAFASGRRGPDVAAVGSIHDESILARTRARSRADQIFRDTGLHFLRRFDVVLGDFTRQASDAEILALADTRTGRAFMLIARVSGTFD